MHHIFGRTEHSKKNRLDKIVSHTRSHAIYGHNIVLFRMPEFYECVWSSCGVILSIFSGLDPGTTDADI